MNDMSPGGLEQDAASSAFRFTGSWREFAPIALTNLLLSLVTLGVYRFWANARERRYLWSRTEFIDDALEWTGTGMEMFKGFLVAAAIVLPVLIFLQFGFEAMLLRGQTGLAIGIAVALYLGLLYLGGVALFRALRYRLSRSYWHGIRGGSDDGGWGYGGAALWKTVVGFAAMGLMIPWSMTSLWNDRWNQMSFGPHRFRADAEFSGLMLRWIAVVLSPFALLLIGGLVVGIMAATGAFEGMASGSSPPSQAVAVALTVAFILGVYALIAFIGLGYYAAYYREVIGKTTLGELEFAFTARSKDWLKLFLGNIGLAVVTLGVGIIFWSYRNWAFFVRHLEAYGNIDPTTLTQSTAAATGDAEGLAGMFDIGAI